MSDSDNLDDSGVVEVPDHVHQLRAEHEVSALTAKFQAELHAQIQSEGVKPRPANAAKRTRANSNLPSRHKVIRDEAAAREAETARRLEELNDGALEREAEAASAAKGSVMEQAKLADAVESVSQVVSRFRAESLSKKNGGPSSSPAPPSSSAVSIADRIRQGVPANTRKISVSSPSLTISPNTSFHSSDNGSPHTELSPTTHSPGRNITPVATDVWDKIRMANAVDAVTTATEAFRKQLEEMRKKAASDQE